MSRKIYNYPIPPNLADRFWSKVKERDKSKCWRWCGAVERDDKWRKKGYGYLSQRFGPRSRNKQVKIPAHFASFYLHRGRKPKPGYIIRHRCNERSCVNPDHLMEGTREDNMRDMVLSGRSLKGEKNPRALFTQEQVDSIRSEHADGATYSQLANKYGCHYETIHNIVRYKTYA